MNNNIFNNFPKLEGYLCSKISKFNIMDLVIYKSCFINNTSDKLEVHVLNIKDNNLTEIEERKKLKVIREILYECKIKKNIFTLARRLRMTRNT